MTWQLWRQDDNGITYQVGTYATRAAAEEKMAGLTRCHHKQTYWIMESAETTTGATS